jgi:hypothetical protein
MKKIDLDSKPNYYGQTITIDEHTKLDPEKVS